MSKNETTYLVNGKYYKIHNSYDPRMKGQKDSRWYMRFLDYIFQRPTSEERRYNILTHFDNFICYFVSFSINFGIIAKIYFDNDVIIHGGWSLIFLFISPARLYRHYRHKYFKEHGLPGPFGLGTVDPVSWD